MKTVTIICLLTFAGLMIYIAPVTAEMELLTIEMIESPVLHLDRPTKAKSEEIPGVLRQVTAYSELDSCHTGKSCLMASGKKAYIGAVACPREIKLGTKVIIDNTPYICEDRTSAQHNGRYDIFYGYGKESYKTALQFGVQSKEVRIFKD